MSEVTLKIIYNIDGKLDLEKACDYIMESIPGCIGSEEVDGTDEWLIEIDGVQLIL